MISVVIYINNQPIRVIRAVRKTGEKHEECTYEVLENDKVIKHHYDKGSVELAIKMLRSTKNMTERELRDIHLQEIAKEMGIQEMID